jgi:hypothetical protein
MKARTSAEVPECRPIAGHLIAASINNILKKKSVITELVRFVFIIKNIEASHLYFYGSPLNINLRGCKLPHNGQCLQSLAIQAQAHVARSHLTRASQCQGRLSRNGTM